MTPQAPVFPMVLPCVKRSIALNTLPPPIHLKLGSGSGYDISYEGWERHAVTWREIPKIKARIIELIDEAKEKMTWDAEKVLNRFDEIYQKALDEQDFTNATRSMENIAKHLGMYVERSEQRIGSLDGMKTEDIDKDISKLADVVGLKVVNGGKSE
jgi:hypothetical protein